MTTALSCLAALLWIAGCAIAVLPLLTPPSRRPTWSEYGVAGAMGAGVLGVVWVLARLISTDEPARWGALAIPLIAAVVIWRRRAWLLPQVTRPGAATIVSCIVCACWLAPAVAGAALMGRGPYPSAFFHVDTPLRLTHVRALQNPGPMPPPSLTNAGQAPAYHYGGPGVAAALATLSGLPPHTALFAVAIPLALIGMVCAARLLAAAFTEPGTLLHAALAAFILTAWSTELLNAADAVWRSVGGWDSTVLRAFLERTWSSPETFGNHFPDVTPVYGRLLLMVSALPLVDRAPRRLWAAATAVALLGQVRAGVGLIAGIVLIAAAAIQWMRTRHHRVMLPVLAGGTAALLALTAGGDTPMLPFTIVIQPLWLARHFPGVFINDLLAVTMIAGLPWLLASGGWSSSERSLARRLALPVAAAVAALYAVYNLGGGMIDERTWGWDGQQPLMPWTDWIQSLIDAPMLFALLGASALAARWPAMRRPRQIGAMVLLGVVATLPLAHRLKTTVLMWTEPLRAHEYVDNRETARAMAVIPVAGTVTATNDLRYPAEDFARDEHQYQLAALFGHVTYAAPGYERYPGWEQRVALQRALASSSVDCNVLRRLEEEGVTHLLIHKRIAHPSSLPLRHLLDDAAYTVFELRGTTC